MKMEGMRQSLHTKEALHWGISLNMVGNSANFGKRYYTKYIFVHVFPGKNSIFQLSRIFEIAFQ